MKKLDKYKAYDYSQLTDEQLNVFRKKVNLMCIIGFGYSNKVYFDFKYKTWLNIEEFDGSHITEFTNAKELFE